MRVDIKVLVIFLIILVCIPIVMSILIPNIYSSKFKQIEKGLKEKMNLEVKKLSNLIDKNHDKERWYCETKNYDIEYPKDIIGWLSLKIQAHQEIQCKWIYNNKVVQKKNYTLIYFYKDKKWILYRRK